MRVWQLIWQGLWQGIGEGSFFLAVYLVWLTFYRAHGHKFDTENILHELHRYFTGQ